MTKWVLRTEKGDIDVSHLTPKQRAQAATDLHMLKFWQRRTDDLSRQYMKTSVFWKRNRRRTARR
jgi:hypothetical protein